MPLAASNDFADARPSSGGYGREAACN